MTQTNNRFNGPLNGIKILDFSTLLPGPYASMMLADMGAEVLRIESPNKTDMLREMTPKYDQRSYAHLTINRNKQSLALDLKQSGAKAVIEQLVEQYDVILEQFRPHVMQRLGLDYPKLKKVNPQLIYCSITGYGQTGPLSDRAGHDINYLALSGLASYSGREETGPVLSGAQIADVAGGSHHAVMAILAAIIQRAKSGEGQHLDISMSDCAMALNTLYGANALANDEAPKCGGEILNGGIFYDYYQTLDNRYLAVGSLESKFAAGFFAAIGRSEWLPRGLKKAGRQQQLKKDISQVIATKPLNEWQQIFASLDVCVEPVLNIIEASQHPHFLSREMFCEVQIDQAKKIKQIAMPVKFESAKSSPQQSPHEQPKRQSQVTMGAKLGENSKVVLEKLGLSDEQIKYLVLNRAVYLG